MQSATQLRELLGGYASEVERCIRCGFCNSVCPTSNIPHAYMGSKTSRGRLVILQSIITGSRRVELSSKLLDLIDLCFGCRRCLEVCPAGIPIPQIMWSVRSAANRMGLHHASWMLKSFIKNYDKLASLASRFPGLANTITRSRLGKALAERLLGIDRKVELPAYMPLRHKSSISSQQRLAYFGDVFGLYHEGNFVSRLFGLLEKLGYGVEVPRGQRQAGIPLLELGLLDEARAIASRNVEILSGYVERGYKILTTSPAAYLALKQDYPKLLDNADSRKVAENTVDAVQLLNELVGSGGLELDSGGRGIVYHSGCFSQATSLSGAIVELLNNAGFKIVGTTQRCCGVAGMWGLLRKHHETAKQVGSTLFNELRDAETIVSQSETCRLWMRSFLGKEILHPVEAILKYCKA
ncbi:MAG: 4Fe-4S dicluster domain-containing protein [Aigarchaeota archaeon]|nr:4Fe-4S dicluster domain-containing protein [Candidatus Pelearchaeum maunauluense]